MDDIKKKISISPQQIFRISDENFFKNNIGPFTVYLGIDPTAQGIHLGHLIPLQLCIDLVLQGCKLIILIGGFTASIGDPTDKLQVRTKLENKTVIDFSAGILKDLKKILEPYNNQVIFVNNNDWLEKFSIRDYIEKLGYIVSIKNKLNLDTFAKRMNDPKLSITMSEFLYPDLQLLDFIFLNEKYGCNIQVGGGDQVGNVFWGVSHLNALLKTQKVLGICTPLLVNNGQKVSKTDKIAPFLSQPENLYHFCLQLSDETASQLCNLIHINQNSCPIKTKKNILRKIFHMYWHNDDVFEQLDSKIQKSFQIEAKECSQSEICHVKNTKLSNILVELKLCQSSSEAKNKILNKQISIDNKIIEQNFDLKNKITFKLKFGKTNPIFIKVTGEK